MLVPALLSPQPALTKEEEAKQVIDQLRADDMAQRVAAAHRLPAVAAVLGPERTRTVRVKDDDEYTYYSHRHDLYSHRVSYHVFHPTRNSFPL